MKKHPEADVIVSFASLRSAYDSVVEAMGYAQVSAFHSYPVLPMHTEIPYLFESRGQFLEMSKD